MMPGNFTYAHGLNDTVYYPDVPADGAAARQQFMDLLNAIKDNMNNSLTQKTDYDAHLADIVYQTAGGTAIAITLTGVVLEDGHPKTFIASADNGGLATTINAKPLYKPNTTTAPILKAGKAYTVWYNLAGDCFFIKASASGTLVASQALAGMPFSNENDTDILGEMPNNSAETKALATLTIQNLVKNSSFENDLTSWFNAIGANGTNEIVTAGQKFGTKCLKTTLTGSSASIFSQDVAFPNGDVIYICGNMKRSTGSGYGLMRARNYGGDAGGGETQGNQISTSAYAISSLIRTSANGGVNVRSAIYTAGTVLYTDGIVAINLTAEFGAGNEPTQAQMDAIMTALGGWFEGSTIIAKLPIGAFITNGATGSPDVLINDPNHVPENILFGKSVLGVEGNAEVPKKEAFGTATSSSLTYSFVKDDGTSVSAYQLVVSGLTFTPRKIIVFSPSNVNHSPTMADLSQNTYTSGANETHIIYSPTNGSDSSVQVYGPATITSTGFSLPVALQSASYSWWAIE